MFQTWEIVDEVENLIDVIGLAKTGAVVTEEYRTHAIITLGAIPPAALIDYAYITFTGQDLRDVGTILRCDIFGHDIDYAATYPTYAQFAAAQSPDDCIADRLPEEREGMPALRLLPEYGG